MREANYFSPIFNQILDTINAVLQSNNLDLITKDQGKVSESKFNKGLYGNKLMWRITSATAPQLLDSSLINQIYTQLKSVFPELLANKTITLGNPKYTTDMKMKPLASIVIMITQLPDNVITKHDLELFANGDFDSIEKCIEIESRMYRRDNDLRSPVERLEDFTFSLIYEPKLVDAKLLNVDNLVLNHQDDIITLEPDKNTDFSGTVRGVACKIEGKSTKADIIYSDTDLGRAIFAGYLEKRIFDHSIGNLHGADYVLFVLKKTGEVICAAAHNISDNWLAGKIDLNESLHF